jgi:hypothetical protein
MKASLRLLGTQVRLGNDGPVGRVVNTASHDGSPMLKIEWADSTVSWHRPGELVTP